MTTAPLTPSPRHEHLYAIVRFETDASADAPIESRITIKKVVRDADNAQAEVKRLNDLNRDKGCYYFMQVTRLEREPVTAVPAAPPGDSATDSHPAVSGTFERSSR